MKSILIPFRFESSPGVLATRTSPGSVATTTDNGIIAKQRIADVLATGPYERVNRPDYGAGINDLLFEPLDPLIIADYKIDAIRTINDYVSNAKIRDIRFEEGGSVGYNGNGESTLIVSVVYDVANTGTSTYTVTLGGEQVLTEETPF